jgi:hypothetical protein
VTQKAETSGGVYSIKNTKNGMTYVGAAGYIAVLPLLLLLMPVVAHGLTPAQDGREQGIANAFGEAHDAGAACSKYQANINDNNTRAAQCYYAYDLAFNQTCLSHPSLMKYRDPYPKYASCYDILHK